MLTVIDAAVTPAAAAASSTEGHFRNSRNPVLDRRVGPANGVRNVSDISVTVQRRSSVHPDVGAFPQFPLPLSGTPSPPRRRGLPAISATPILHVVRHPGAGGLPAISATPVLPVVRHPGAGDFPQFPLPPVLRTIRHSSADGLSAISAAPARHAVRRPGADGLPAVSAARVRHAVRCPGAEDFPQFPLPLSCTLSAIPAPRTFRNCRYPICLLAGARAVGRPTRPLVRKLREHDPALRGDASPAVGGS